MCWFAYTWLKIDGFNQICIVPWTSTITLIDEFLFFVYGQIQSLPTAASYTAFGRKLELYSIGIVYMVSPVLICYFAFLHYNFLFSLFFRNVYYLVSRPATAILPFFWKLYSGASLTAVILPFIWLLRSPVAIAFKICRKSWWGENQDMNTLMRLSTLW